jgi:hypothetical protein
VERTIIGAIGDNRDKAALKYAENLPGVEKTMPILKPYKLASRESHEGDTVVRVGSVDIGGNDFVVMAGPCAIESEEQLLESAYIVKKAAGGSSAAAPTSRERRLIASRAWKRRGSNCSMRQDGKRISPR